MLSQAFLSRRTIAVLVVNAFLLLLGCGPANLAMFMMPFSDTKVPPEWKLADPDKEVTVAIMSSFSNGDRPNELLSGDNELADKLQANLRKRFQENKDKVKFVPLAQVRNQQNRYARQGGALPEEVGKALKADVVIVLDIKSMSLYEERSMRQLYRGRSVITVNVFDMKKDQGERNVWDKPYSCEYPGTRGPVEASGNDVSQFRSMFLSKVADDLSRFFAAYESDERFKLD